MSPEVSSRSSSVCRMGIKIWFAGFVTFLSGCAVTIEQLPPPEQADAVVSRVTEISPKARGSLSAEPGDTLLRVRDYNISEQVINTNMWTPEADFTVDAIAWPPFSSTKDDFYVAIGKAKWRGESYLVLDAEDGNISWGSAKNAHLLMREDGSFDGVMGVETGTFKTKIVNGPNPVKFSPVQIEKVDVIRDDSYQNFEIILVDSSPDEILLLQKDFIHNSDDEEVLL